MGERGLSTPQVHQLRAVGKSCLRNEGKRPGSGLCCDTLFFKNLIPMWRKQKTDTDDGLFPDSEIAKQLVAQFINNMLVKTSPWPQVCL